MIGLCLHRVHLKKETKVPAGHGLVHFGYGRCEKTMEQTILHSKIQHFCAGVGKNMTDNILY
jgi:hypothetical protein